MKTDELIALLASGETAVDRHAVARRLGLALLVGSLGALALVVALYGMRDDLAQMLQAPPFWGRIALPGSLALLALGLAGRLARPGIGGGVIWPMLGLPLLVVWLGAALSLSSAAPEARAEMILGQTWRTCSLNIALLSIPAFSAISLALRGLAPTRLRLAGAAAGLLAGATAAIAYCLHCPEMSIAFWGVWYLLGILIPTLLGAVFGPLLLRW